MSIITTLKQAYAITSKMTAADDNQPTTEQRDAKCFVYENVVKPKYGDNVPPHMEPDWNEGWK